MSDRATERARLCFTLAADTRSPEGERAAALNRGMAILRRAGLNPDHFDIPGRERPQWKPGTAWKGEGRSPWLDGFEQMERMRATGMAFSVDEFVREAVRESMRRRRERATECEHGFPYGMDCTRCEYERSMAAKSRTCPHGMVGDEFCVDCVDP